MAYITINHEACKSCGFCMQYCPKGILERGEKVNAMGYVSVLQKTPELCTGCKLCAVMCPDYAIEVYR